MKVTNKIVVITGAGNGMGREEVLYLLSKGAKVAAVDFNEAALQETKQLAGDKANNLSLHIVNITDKPAVDALPEQVIAAHGAIDILLNNAGVIQPFVKINDLDFEHINRVMNINFYGTLNITKAFLPYLLKRPEAYIADVSSMGGFLPVPGQGIYGASKAAVKLMTEALRAELTGTNVHVSIIFPGAIGTNIAKNSGVAMPSMGSTKETEKAMQQALSPAKAAQIIIDGIEANKPRIFVGSDSKAMDILYRLAPTFAVDFIAKKMKSLLS